MTLAFVLFGLQQVAFLFFTIESGFYTRSTSIEAHAIVIAAMVFSVMLGIPSAAWNYFCFRRENEKKYVVAHVISLITFVIGVAFLVFAYICRFNSLSPSFIH